MDVAAPQSIGEFHLVVDGRLEANGKSFAEPLELTEVVIAPTPLVEFMGSGDRDVEPASPVVCDPGRLDQDVDPLLRMDAAVEEDLEV